MSSSGPDDGWASRVDAAAHVFVGEGELAEPGSGLTISGDDGHHLADVLRLRPGEVVTVADGTGGWQVGEIVETRSRELRLVITTPARREPRLRPMLTVAFSLMKGEKADLVVQKLTELGIDTAIPMATERSVVRWDTERRRVAVERWRRVARSAALQCRRACHMEIAEVSDLGSVLERPGVVVAAPDGLPGVAASEWMGGRSEIVAVVGPEGGFSGAEALTLGQHPAFSLGPHVLRAETATIASAAVFASARLILHHGEGLAFGHSS